MKLLILMLLIFVTPALADEENPVWPWQIGHLSYSEWGNTESKGYSLYTTETDTYGTAFRCHKKRLYVFLAAKKVTIADMMLRRTWNSKKWSARLSINGSEERDEPWISFVGGRMFMAVESATAHELFAAGRDGIDIVFTPRRGKPINIRVPVDGGGYFERFEELCGF